MTARRQIFLLVVLLFVGCGALGAAIAWRLQTGALERGFQDKTRTMGAALGEFIEPGDVAALAAGRRLGATRLAAVMRRMDRWSILKRLALLDAGSGRLLADTAPGAGALPAPAEWRGLGPDEVRLLPLRPSPSGDEIQPFVALAAGGAAVVEGELSAGGYLRARRSILDGAIGDAAVATLIGLAVAGGIAAFVGRQIRRVRLAVETVGSPAFAPDRSESLVQEVADLDNTVGVMHGVLADTVAKTRSLLVESERYRSERGLARALQDELGEAPVLEGGGAEAAWFSVGTAAPASFAGLVARGPSQGAAFVGIAGSAEQVDPVLRARAASAYLRDALAREPLEAAAASACALFGLSRLAAAAWDRDGLRRWTSEGAAPPAPWPGATVALDCLGPVNRERMAAYLANFPTRPAAAANGELPALMDPAETGAALVLSPKAT